MLSSQARLTDCYRSGIEGKSAELQGRLDRSHQRWFFAIWVVSIAFAVSILGPHASGQSKGRKGKIRGKRMPSSSPGEQSLTNIPLPIGHEAKGLVLPDFDGDGHLRGKFEAGTANRIDQEHVGFEQLKITTYTPEDQPDLKIDMSTSVLDLKTRILTLKNTHHHTASGFQHRRRFSGVRHEQ